ncbi:MAG: T9SS type A sorting domain-containing protein [Fidelibacterota bacterium]|nr:MAG: T9SS type A sorting domain-containing protein [Candidatus Neomarinimicrobiota bacterium]
MKRIAAAFIVLILIVGTWISLSNTGDIQPDSAPHPFERISFTDQKIPIEHQQRYVTGDAYYRAFLRSKKNADHSLDLNAPDQWESIGPNNQGGRTIALEIDPHNPNIIYAGAATGGLWRLTSTGSGSKDYSWEKIETGYPVLGVGAIAVDPRDSNVIYVGTGEAHMHRDHTVPLGRFMFTYGIGILKSTDRGLTWKKCLDWSYNQNRGVFSIECNPHNPDIIFTGTTEGIYRSRDNGASWEQVLDVIMANDLDINPDNPDIIFAACGNIASPGTGLYRSLDGGDNWARLTTGLPESWTGKARLDIYRAEPEIIFADIYDIAQCRGLYRSADNGDTWTLVTEEGMGNATGLYAHYVRVSPVSEQKIFRAEQKYGYSEDGGINYTRFESTYGWLEDSTVMHVDHHTFVNHPDDPEMFYAGNDGGVYRTYDGGKTFQDLNEGYVTTQFYAGFSSSRTDPNLAIGGTQDNGTSVYDGSADWRICVLGSDGGATAIDPADNNILYGLRPRLGLFKSEDRGANFRFIGPVDFWEGYFGNPNSREPHPDEWSKFPAPIQLVPPRIMYAATNYVYKSLDGGETWECVNRDRSVSPEPLVSMAVSETNPDVVYVASYPNAINGNRARVYRTKNGGAHWRDITGSLPDRYLNVFLSPHNEDVVHVTTYGFGTSHLYRSLDAGRSWENIGAQLPDVPTTTVEVDPACYQHIYVGNDLGVWVSLDDGDTWDQFNLGLPDAVLVTDLSISESNRKIRASTHGNGVYERSLLAPSDIVYSTAPVQFELRSNYPNPFNSTTSITFSIQENATASIHIYDVTGKLVKTFTEDQYIRGISRVVWDGRNDSGHRVSSGIYLYKLTVNGISQTARMTFVK